MRDALQAMIMNFLPVVLTAMSKHRGEWAVMERGLSVLWGLATVPEYQVCAVATCMAYRPCTVLPSMQTPTGASMKYLLPLPLSGSHFLLVPRARTDQSLGMVTDSALCIRPRNSRARTALPPSKAYTHPVSNVAPPPLPSRSPPHPTPTHPPCPRTFLCSRHPWPRRPWLPTAPG
jgi:hypothetical protein